MGLAMKKCTEQSENLMKDVKNLKSIKRKINIEIKELLDELRMQKGRSTEPGLLRAEELQGEAPRGSRYLRNIPKTPAPMPPPPSLHPVLPKFLKRTPR